MFKEKLKTEPGFYSYERPMKNKTYYYVSKDGKVTNFTSLPYMKRRAMKDDVMLAYNTFIGILNGDDEK